MTLFEPQTARASEFKSESYKMSMTSGDCHQNPSVLKTREDKGPFLIYASSGLARPVRKQNETF